MSDDKYDYRIATKEDRQAILDYLMKYFRNEEPLNRAARLPEEQFLAVIEKIVDGCLKDPLSTVVHCKRTGALAAVLLNSISDRAEGKQNISFGNEASPSVSTFGWILNELHNSFFDLAPAYVKKVIHMEIISVGKPYQRQGIATKIMNFSYPREKLEKYELDGIVSETTSLANQVLQAKRGYKTLKVIRLADLKDEQGKQIIVTDDGTETALLNWIPTKDL